MKTKLLTLAICIFAVFSVNLAYGYYQVSPYAYTLNNPVRYIDPDGMDVWEMDYMGRVNWKEESDNHIMYALNKDGARTGQSITVGDRSIFDGLTTTGKNSNYAASYVHGNASELASVFLFAADNSNAEWRFSRYDVGGGDQYAIGTVHENALAISPSQMGFARENEIAFIHSHPTKHANVGSEIESMGWVSYGNVYRPSDSYNVGTNRNGYRSYDNYLTYFPYSGNIYQVRGAHQPAHIRNIKNHHNNPQRLFWGTLNGR